MGIKETQLSKTREMEKNSLVSAQAKEEEEKRKRRGGGGVLCSGVWAGVVPKAGAGSVCKQVVS